MIYIYNKNELTFDRIKTRKYLLFFLPFIVLFMFFGYVTSSVMFHPNVIEKLVYQDRLVILSEPKVNDTILSEYLKKYHIKFPYIVMAQALHESNRYTSDIFFENYNLLGMKVPNNRPTTSLGTRRGHAYYKNWEMCVLDYALYQSAYLRDIRTESQYLEYLNKYYATDPSYKINLGRYIKETKPFFN